MVARGLVRNPVDSSNEILDGCLCCVLGIDEAHRVGNLPVAKEDRKPVPWDADRVWLIQGRLTMPAVQ